MEYITEVSSKERIYSETSLQGHGIQVLMAVNMKVTHL
jgi:hypothetical protein